MSQLPNYYKMKTVESDGTDSSGDMYEHSKDIWKSLVAFGFNLIPEEEIYQEQEKNKAFPATTTELVYLLFKSDIS